MNTNTAQKDLVIVAPISSSQLAALREKESALRAQEAEIANQIQLEQTKIDGQLTEAIKALPGQFGVANIEEFINLVKNKTGIAVRSSVRSAKRSYRTWQANNKSHRLSKEQRSAMFGELKLVQAGTKKVKQVAKQFKVSRQTVYNMLRKAEQGAAAA